MTGSDRFQNGSSCDRYLLKVNGQEDVTKQRARIEKHITGCFHKWVTMLCLIGVSAMRRGFSRQQLNEQKYIHP